MEKTKKYYVNVEDLLNVLPKEFEFYCAPDDDPIRKARRILADMCIREAASFGVGVVEEEGGIKTK